MNMKESTDFIKSLSVTERILLVQEIWDGIAAEADLPQLTDVEREELDRRLDAYQATPDAGTTWETLKDRLLARK
jgi:putative addiction module component (TIGR02574 family)